MNNLSSPRNSNQIVWTVMYLFILTNWLSSRPTVIFFFFFLKFSECSPRFLDENSIPNVSLY